MATPKHKQEVTKGRKSLKIVFLSDFFNGLFLILLPFDIVPTFKGVSEVIDWFESLWLT